MVKRSDVQRMQETHAGNTCRKRARRASDMERTQETHAGNACRKRARRASDVERMQETHAPAEGRDRVRPEDGARATCLFARAAPQRARASRVPIASKFPVENTIKHCVRLRGGDFPSGSRSSTIYDLHPSFLEDISNYL